MKLNSSDANTEMEMNMTSMIDVVFLLIIFFMIITDLTQQDLEQLELPLAMAAVPDKPDPKVVRPVLNIIDTGSIIVKGDPKFDPETKDWTEVRNYLSDQARLMPKEFMNKEAQSGQKIPDNPLLIRADQNTPFKYIQKVMAICGEKGIQIWKLELAAKDPQDPNNEAEE